MRSAVSVAAVLAALSLGACQDKESAKPVVTDAAAAPAAGGNGESATFKAVKAMGPNALAGPAGAESVTPLKDLSPAPPAPAN